MPMHYIPQYHDDDEEEEVSSKSSSRSSLWSKDRDKDSKKKRNRNKKKAFVPVPPPTGPQKATKKLKSLITRTFAKQQPAPIDEQQDALLSAISFEHEQQEVHSQSQTHSHGGTSSAAQRPSGYSTPSRYESAHQEWNRSQQAPSVASGSVTGDYYSVKSFPHDLPIPEPVMTKAQKEKLRSDAQEEIRAYMEFSVWHCLLAIVLYVVLSILCFSFVLEKEWTTLDSSYFAVVTFTTIGYGDVVPDTRMARIFTCFWAISGVACLGIALGVVGTNLIVVHEQEMAQADNERQSDMLHGLFDEYDTPTAAGYDDYGAAQQVFSTPKSYSTVEEGRRRVMFDNMEDSDDDNPKQHRRRRNKHNVSCWKRCCGCFCSQKFCRSVFLFVYLAAILYAISVIENWDASTTIYYGIITASTVGYGDFCPKTETGRLLATMFIPAAVCIMGFFLDFVANTIIDYRRQGYHAYLDNKPLTLEDIQILDGDGDGEVTRAEFLEFMLVAMNKVDKDLLKELGDHFDKLDFDKSGTINKDDLAFINGGSERLHRDEQEAWRRATGTTITPTTSTETNSRSSNLRPLTLVRDTTKQTSNRASSPRITPQTLATEPTHATYQNGGRGFF